MGVEGKLPAKRLPFLEPDPESENIRLDPVTTEADQGPYWGPSLLNRSDVGNTVTLGMIADKPLILGRLCARA